MNALPPMMEQTSKANKNNTFDTVLKKTWEQVITQVE